jgi:hypothetical protein
MLYKYPARVLETGQIEARLKLGRRGLTSIGLSSLWVLAHESKPNQKYHASARAPPEAWGY